MDKNDIINLAKAYLLKRAIPIVEPGKLGRKEGTNQEVIFLDPLILDLDVAVVDPGEIRVWVDVKTKKVTLIPDM